MFAPDERRQTISQFGAQRGFEPLTLILIDPPPQIYGEPTGRISWFFCNDLTVFQDIYRRTVHPRRLTRGFCGESQAAAHSSSKTLWPLSSLSTFHGLRSSNIGEAPELSYIAQESAIGW